MNTVTVEPTSSAPTLEALATLFSEQTGPMLWATALVAFSLVLVTVGVVGLRRVPPDTSEPVRTILTMGPALLIFGLIGLALLIPLVYSAAAGITDRRAAEELGGKIGVENLRVLPGDGANRSAPLCTTSDTAASVYQGLSDDGRRYDLTVDARAEGGDACTVHVSERKVQP